MEVLDITVSIIISVVARIASSQEAENVINENIKEEWAKYWALWHTTVNTLCNLPRTEFIIVIDFLHPYI